MKGYSWLGLAWVTNLVVSEAKKVRWKKQLRQRSQRISELLLTPSNC
jgi:hypothetical protein